MSLPLLVVMVPVFFGFMGFAIDLGRLYLIRGELNEAANAMALASAQQLNGSTGADANSMAVLPPPLGTGPVYNYNFGSVPVGQGAGNLTSAINAPACYAAASDAVAGNGNVTDCSTAQYVQVSLTADAPLLFWSLLPGGQSGKTSIAAQAVAGISAPLCTACNIVPIGIVAINSTDTVNFGFDATFSSIYNFSYSCVGTPPAILNGTVPYYILNRLDSGSSLTENDQLYVDGAGGLTASATPTPNANTSNASTPLACVNVADQEQVWADAVPLACSGTPAPPRTTIESMLCGIFSRLDNSQTPSACTLAVDDFASLSNSYLPDTDAIAGEVPPYTAYTGDNRRLITVAIMDRAPLTATDNPTVLAFRQFLLVPNTDGTFFQPTDPYGRFPALYIGNPAPVQTGWFDGRYANACVQGSFTGPGKVVLHQ
jgi:Flp pilus assembly protein TadG